MAYANFNAVSQTYIDGGIVITDEQYLEGVHALLEGKYVTIDNGFEIKDPPPPPEPDPDPEPSPYYSLFKTTVWARMTDAEAEIVFAAKKSQPAKFQGIWDDAVMIDTQSLFFPMLSQFLVALFGQVRAQELLAKES